MNPVEGSSIHSRFPPTSVTTEGRPQIMASTRLKGVPSDREGSTSRWLSAQMDRMSPTCPQNSILSAIPQYFANRSRKADRHRHRRNGAAIGAAPVIPAQDLEKNVLPLETRLESGYMRDSGEVGASAKGRVRSSRD